MELENRVRVLAMRIDIGNGSNSNSRGSRSVAVDGVYSTRQMGRARSMSPVSRGGAASARAAADAETVKRQAQMAVIADAADTVSAGQRGLHTLV